MIYIVLIIMAILFLLWIILYPSVTLHSFDGTVEHFRIQHYCQDVQYTSLTCLKNESDLYVEPATDLKPFREYGKDMQRYIELLDKPDYHFKWWPYDRVEWFDIPTLVKSRSVTPPKNISLRGSIVCRLNVRRHFGTIRQLAGADIPFEQKKNAIVWRGAPTGYGFGNNIPFRPVSRQTLVEKYANEHSLRNHINIGLVQCSAQTQQWIIYARPRLSLQELLQYKYILSVEGHDVATNLKWILKSQSLLFMHKPYIESWIMEGFLIPNIHYIQVRDDFSDLTERMEWCNNHPSECKRIIRNANKYISMFLDENRELSLQKRVLQTYCQNVQWL